MEKKINISSLISETKNQIGLVKWIDPRNVIGLPSKSEVLEMELSEDWDESFSDALYDYIDEWFRYTQWSSYIDDGESRSPLERYIDSMLYIYVTYHNSVAGLFNVTPYLIDVEGARKCLPIFKNYILNESLTSSDRITIQTYLSDFYQFMDLWNTEDGRFHSVFTNEENALLSYLYKYEN